MPEYLTVRELAELLRIKERKVYDLAASGAVPCTRATGKLLFPEAGIRAWMAAASTGPAGGARGARPAIFLGSHDPLLEWALRRSGCGLATRFEGSGDGLARFAAGEGVAAGLHLRDPATGAWNIPAVTAAGVDGVLVSWAVRRRGLVLRPEQAGAVRGLADLRGLVVAPRQPGSGTQQLFDQLAAAAGLAPETLDYGAIAPSEHDAVQEVARGAADAAFGLEQLAVAHGLPFVPMIEERFDILADRRAWFEPPMQRLWAFCRGETFRGHAAELAGYDIAGLGQVRWNGGPQGLAPPPRGP